MVVKGFKLDILEFKGCMQPDELLDLVVAVEEILEFKDGVAFRYPYIHNGEDVFKSFRQDVFLFVWMTKVIIFTIVRLAH